MAEFDNEVANLDLYREIFNLKSPQDELLAIRTIPVVGCRDVNKVGDLNIKNYSYSSTFLQSSILNSEFGSGLMKHANDTVDAIEDKDSSLSYENSVRLQNLANVKKTESNSAKSVDEKYGVEGEGEDNVISHTNFVNGILNTVHTSGAKEYKKKKAVSFPKDTLIAGYFDPPDPWKNAPSWSTDKLVSSYKKSCEVQGIKPIVKLIQQLQAFSSLGKREEMLSLKGEKLDQKQCECLEDIFKRVQFKMLDLESSHLDDECAVALFDMIEFYESACQLSIAFNKNIQARGWQACSRLVRRTPSLTCLDLRGCDLNDHTIPIFGRALKLGCHLTVLHMENMNLSGRPLLILVAALKTNETLQELFLSENKFMPTDGVQLGNLLRYNHKLRLLDLRNNHLQIMTILKQGSALSTFLFNSALEKIRRKVNEECKSKDIGASHLSDGLMEQNKGSGLHTLVLWNNNINYQAMSNLGRALASSQQLKTLNIGHNAITNEGIHRLKDGLLRVNSLLRLGLQGTRISDEGAVALAEYIAESRVLLRIDLRDNDIKTGGLMALSHAMRVNTSVSRIDLDKEPKKDPGMKDYVEQQSRLLRDIFTFQQRNVQLAFKREEQERIQLKLKTEADKVATQNDPKVEQLSITLPANSSTESFTFIEEVCNKDTAPESYETAAENSQAMITDKNCKEKTVSPEKSKDLDELESQLQNEDRNPQQRPNVLFPYHVLPPHTSAYSSTATSDVSHFMSVASEPFSAPPQSGHPSQRVAAIMDTCSTPAEMILSPQYFPKQFARKMFSVIRVHEDPFCQQSSLSPVPLYKLSDTLDSVSVSPKLLAPAVSSAQLPTSMPILLCAEEVPQHVRASQQMISPSSLLFKDLAEETIKHMVSPDADMGDQSLQVKDLEPASSHETPSNVQDFGGVHGALSSILESSKTGVESSNTCIKSLDTGVKLSDCSELAASGKTLPASYRDTGICDNFESPVKTTADNMIPISTSGERLRTDNLEEGSALVKNFSIVEDREVLALEDKYTLQQKALLSEDSFADSHYPSKLSLASQDFDLKKACAFDHQGGSLENDCVTETDLSRSDMKTEYNKQLCDVSCDNPFLFVEESKNSDAVFSIEDINDSDTIFSIEDSSECDAMHDTQDYVSTFLHVKDANQTEHLKVSNDKGELLQKHCRDPHALSENFQSVLLASEKHSSPIVIDMSTSKVASACLNNFSSPSLLVSENTEEMSSIKSWGKSVVNQSASGESKDHSLSTLMDLMTHDTHDISDRNYKKVDALIKSEVSNKELKSDSPNDTLVKVNNLISDNIFIENVDFSLDEEPWLTVGVDSDGNDPESSRKSSRQPDFFTTLSLNGLTQELASALTSLDGPTSPFEVEN